LKRLFQENQSVEILQSELDQARDMVAQLRQELQQAQSGLAQAWTLATRHVIMNSSEEAFFETELNGVRVLVPRDTLRTWIDCIYGATTSVGLRAMVETAHLEWMIAQMAPGGTFLDVGSATGAMTIPMAVKFGSQITIVAFEPARKARELLTKTLRRNALDRVEVVPQAISNQVGVASFAEYGYDDTGTIPFLPECSAIHSEQIDNTRATVIEVPVTTLDTFVGKQILGRPVVIKIDVEGFEALVLEGASRLISTVRPSLAIDIHADPFGEGTTEAKVRTILVAHGYKTDMMAHVLIAAGGLTDEAHRIV
jgi:FkbM family methyltransferase